MGPSRDLITGQRLAAELLNLYSDGKISRYFTLDFGYPQGCFCSVPLPLTVTDVCLFPNSILNLTSAAKSALSAQYNPVTFDLSFPLSASRTVRLCNQSL